jgi:hypothetical protein
MSSSFTFDGGGIGGGPQPPDLILLTVTRRHAGDGYAAPRLRTQKAHVTSCGACTGVNRYQAAPHRSAGERPTATRVK